MIGIISSTLGVPRIIWRNSLTNIAMTRASENPVMPRIHSCKVSRMVTHQVDEDILQRRARLDPPIRRLAMRRDRGLQRRPISAADMQPLAERCRHQHAGRLRE